MDRKTKRTNKMNWLIIITRSKTVTHSFTAITYEQALYDLLRDIEIEGVPQNVEIKKM